MNKLSTQVDRLATDLDALADSMEADLEEVLDHRCRVTVDDVDPQTGKVSLRAEVDLDDLRESLAAHDEYDGYLAGIDAAPFVFHLAPGGEP